MCMQDLVISRSVTLRTVTAVEQRTIGVSTYLIIPPNPNRVWVQPHDASTGAPYTLTFLTDGGVPVTMRSPTGGTGAVQMASSDLYPGLPGMTLGALVSAGTPAYTEMVYDKGLAEVVSAEFTKLTYPRRE